MCGAYRQESRVGGMASEYLVDYVYGEGMVPNEMTLLKVVSRSKDGRSLRAQLTKPRLQRGMWVPGDDLHPDAKPVLCDLVYMRKCNQTRTQTHRGRTTLLLWGPEWRLPAKEWTPTRDGFVLVHTGRR